MEKKIKISIIFSTLLASFINPFILSSVNVAMPEIAKDLYLSPENMTWLSISFLLSSTVVVIPMGKIADKYGRVKIFKLGFISFSILTLLCGLSFTKEQLIFFRFLQGIGAGMIFSTAVAIISSVFQKGERGKYLGLSASSVYTGLTSGPILGGILTQKLGWRSIFILTFLISISIIWLIKKNIKIDWKNENMEINNKIMTIYIVAMSLIIYSSSNVIKHKVLFLISVLLFIGYITMEIKSEKKFIDIKGIILNKPFCYSNLSAFFHYSATFSITFLLSLYLQYIYKLTPQKTGLILSFMPFFMMVLSPISGKFSDKKNPAHFTSLGIFLTIIGFIPFILIEKLNVSEIILSLSITGTGFAFFSSPNTNQAITSIHNSLYSTASGILSTMRVLGQNTSMSIINTIFYFYLSGKDILSNKENFIKSFKLSILISIILLFISLYFSVKKINQKNN